MGTPTIVQQRIVLLVFCALIGTAAWWQSEDSRADYPVQKLFNTKLPKGADALDFSMAEAAWSDLRIDSQGNLQIDALTESALLDALPFAKDSTSMTRMTLLLEKQFGARASRQIMELLPLLKNYKEAEQRWLAENGAKNPLPYAQLFQLQDALLGASLADRLFSEQRRIANMMLASQQIRSDAGLTQEQKEQALLELQDRAQQEDAAVE